MTWDRLALGLGLVLATATAFLAVAVGAIVSHPNGLGLLLVVSIAVTGWNATASVWRDRL